MTDQHFTVLRTLQSTTHAFGTLPYVPNAPNPQTVQFRNNFGNLSKWSSVDLLSNLFCSHT